MASDISRVLTVAAGLLAGCAPGSEAGWIVEAPFDVELSSLDNTGCLEVVGQTEPGEQLTVTATDGRWFLLDRPELTVVPVESVEVISEEPVEAPPATVQVPGLRYTLNDDDCVEPTDDVLGEGDAVLGLARWTNDNLRGVAVVDRQLGMANYREVDSDGWPQPWKASVQIVKPLDDGFVIGGGVVVGPRTILTVAHLGVDDSFCYSRGPNSGDAWAAGRFVCGNIAAVDEPAPNGVDLAVLTLAQPDAGPFATIASEPVQAGDAFYGNLFSTQHAREFDDGEVHALTHNNAWCEGWPFDTSFVSEDPMLTGGDSGGPAWVGDEVVGLAHGDACIPLDDEQGRHVWVHLPGLLEYLPDEF